MENQLKKYNSRYLQENDNEVVLSYRFYPFDYWYA